MQESYNFDADKRYQSGLLSLNQPDSLETRQFYFKKFFNSDIKTGFADSGIKSKVIMAAEEEDAAQLLDDKIQKPPAIDESFQADQTGDKAPTFAEIIKLGILSSLNANSQVESGKSVPGIKEIRDAPLGLEKLSVSHLVPVKKPWET